MARFEWKTICRWGAIRDSLSGSGNRDGSHAGGDYGGVKMPASILIVDDESGIRESLGALLREDGYEIDTAASAEECLERVTRQRVDLILLDVWLPQMDGLEMLERLQSQENAPMVVMISGHGNIETAVRATKLGAFDFVEKPLSLEKVVLVVRNALDFLRLDAFDKHDAQRARLGNRRQRNVNGLAWCAQAVLEATEQSCEATIGAAPSADSAPRESGFEDARIAGYLIRNAAALAAAAAARPTRQRRRRGNRHPPPRASRRPQQPRPSNLAT